MLNSLGVSTCRDLYEQRAILLLLFSRISSHFFLQICLGIGSSDTHRQVLCCQCTQANRVIKVSSIISCMQATIILHSSVSLLSTGTMALMCVQSVEGSLLCTPRTVSYSYKLSHLVAITQGFEVNLSTGEKVISCTCLALLPTGVYH